MSKMKKRILTGDTPTGKLHIGHYVGTLEERVKLQGEYETFIILADMHALTTLANEPKKVKEYTYEILLDNLAVGLDPKKVTFFVESLVPELYELATILSMYVSHNRVLRNPTVKDEIRTKELGDTFSLGFVSYPVYQAADILCVKGNLVPVGVDQVPHIEQTRELARDINKITGKEIFPIPEPKTGRVSKLLGLDGQKMGKSLGNAIYLSDSDEEIEKKIMGAFTDPNRIHTTDPGKVEGNMVFAYLEVFGVTEEDRAKLKDFEERYVEGKVGDVEVKEYLIEVMKRFIDPIRKKRKEFEDNPKELERILKEGSEKVRKITTETLEELKEGLGLNY
jgi:tryptophanyl-tRNA synthetase